MNTRIKTFRDNTVIYDKAGIWHCVTLRIGTGVHDKVRCDDYRGAMEYFRAFCKIAKARS